MTTTTTYIPKGVLLVTGGAGFVGSGFVRHVARKYPHYRVVVFDRLDYPGSEQNIASSPGVEFFRGDLKRPEDVARVFREYAIDTVVHFAANSHVDTSFRDSVRFTMDNCVGTHNLLEMCRTYGEEHDAAAYDTDTDANTITGRMKVRRFLYVSTDEVYGDVRADTLVALQENSLLRPTNPYAASKACGELMCMSYARSFGLPVLMTRGNNVYGPHQFPEKLVSKFIVLLMSGRPLPIHGTGRNLRSYLYVDDVAYAYDTVLHKGNTGETYNIGTHEERTVLEVTDDLTKAFHRATAHRTDTAATTDTTTINRCDDEPDVRFVRDRLYNDTRYFIDSRKLRALGWEPATTWKRGLDQTVAWYLDTDIYAVWDRDAVLTALG